MMTMVALVLEIETSLFGFFVLLRDHKTFQLYCINHTVLNDEFTECVVYFGSREFVTKGHKRVFEHVCVDFAVTFEGIESLKDGVIIISTSGHLLCEKHNHHVKLTGPGASESMPCASPSETDLPTELKAATMSED